MESEFERQFVTPKEGRTLIVGSRVYKERPDRRKLYPDVLGIDMEAGEGVDLVLNLEGTLPRDLGKFDHIECCSVLEHSRKPWAMALNIQRLMNPGATIFVAAPLTWRLHGYPSDYWRFTVEGVKELFPGIDWIAAKYASHQLDDGPKLPVLKHKDHPYLGRSMSCLFGVRKSGNGSATR